MGQLSGKVVVVTGASAGVGRAVVRAFAARGADLGLIARGQEGLEAARREVEAQGGRALVLPLDVSEARAVDETLLAIVRAGADLILTYFATEAARRLGAPSP